MITLKLKSKSHGPSRTIVALPNNWAGFYYVQKLREFKRIINKIILLVIYVWVE